MRLDFIMLADAAETDETGKLQIQGGAIGHIVLPHLPARLPQLVVVARLLIEEGDRRGTHTLQARISLRDGDDVEVLAPAVIPAGALDRAPPPHEGEVQTITVIATFPAPSFTHYGQHVAELVIDDRTMGRVVFAVWPEAVPHGDVPLEDLH
jgi:hypothetical protein